MIPRSTERHLLKAAKSYPVLAVTGPRQSGKTTLCRKLFSDRPYVSFENPDFLERFESDPRGFLKAYKDGAVFDEAQKSPDLFSYLQQLVDESKHMGRFVLTGSSQFQLNAKISQSLAGRVVTLDLLPFDLNETDHGVKAVHDLSVDEYLYRGQYPPIIHRGVKPALWYSNYVRNYIERDVRSLLNVGDLVVFQRFVRLCAARTGSLLNLSEIGTQAGVSHNTVRSWLSVLEASYIIFLLPPFYGNFSKRLVKTPKLYFYDTGLLCYLLSIRDPEQLNFHPMRGQVFESFVCSELMKNRYNSLQDKNLYFWRDRSGHEIDIILDHGLKSTPIEVKSAFGFQPRFCKEVIRWRNLTDSEPPMVIYGGDEGFEYNDCRIVPWRSIKDIRD